MSLMNDSLIRSGPTRPLSIGRAQPPPPADVTLESGGGSFDVAVMAGGGTNCLRACFQSCSIRAFISTGLPMTSWIPAFAATSMKSGDVERERRTIRHLNANSGSPINRWAASIASPDFHSPSSKTISGMTASCEHCE